MASEQLEMVIQMLRSRPTDETATIQEMRAGLDAMVGAAPLPEGAVAEPASADGVPVEWVRGAGASSDAVLLYLHGGGYVMGSIASHRAHVARLSQLSGATGLVVDYRLGPEHPFPAAVEDAVKAYRWLVHRGADPRRVAIGGDSAGGGLTVATLVALRDAGERLPACGVCLSPWTDLAGSGASMLEREALDPMVTRDRLLRMAREYLGDQDPRHPLASPIHADLAGLPPLLVHVGTAETLLDDSTRLAERARAAGVPVELEIWDDMIHVFQMFAPLLPEADRANEKIAAFLRGRLAA